MELVEHLLTVVLEGVSVQFVHVALERLEYTADSNGASITGLALSSGGTSG